jgi:hypothetical protein
MPRQYKKQKVSKKHLPLIVEEILPPIVEENVDNNNGYETPDEGITIPKDITYAPKRKYKNDIGMGNNFSISKFPKI